jgi:hypothetical protein
MDERYEEGAIGKMAKMLTVAADVFVLSLERQEGSLY